MEIEEIGYIYTDFEEKFGIPRQSGLIQKLEGRIVFSPKYRNPDYIRGLENFSHIWLIWGFSKSHKVERATSRPPRLGGNEKVGVFATRSPYRPNPLALSCVKIEKIENDIKNGYTILVSGVDMANKTPIYDIKPYLAFSDSVPTAKCSFAEDVYDYSLKVEYDENVLCCFPDEKKDILIEILKSDPRPHYIEDENRIFGFEFAGYEIKFKVAKDVLTVLSAEKARC
jgi:tRNA-Thr(GGU) m(6)t(6)A37 methyltransferase TsaA